MNTRILRNNMSRILGFVFLSSMTVSATPIIESWSNDVVISEARTIDSLTISTGCTVTIPDGITLTVKALTGDKPLRKVGSGTLEVGFVTSTTEISAEEGLVRFIDTSKNTSELSTSALFHVDASLKESFEYTGDTTNGMPFVQKWMDVRGEGYPYAWNGGDLNAWKAEGNAPARVDNRLNGLPTVDFFSPKSYRLVDGVGMELTADGWGGRLNYSTPLTGIREVFLVVADDETAIKENRFQYILGSNGGGADYSFWREGTRGIIGSYAKASLREGLCEYDGQVCNYNKTIMNGFHLIHMRATIADVTTQSFAKNRNSVWGGISLAEVIVFQNEGLDEDTALELSWRLRAKWFGMDSLKKLKLGPTANIEVVANRTVKVTDYEADGVKTKAGAGTLSIGSFANARMMSVTEGTIEVNASLDTLTVAERADAIIGSNVHNIYSFEATKISKTTEGELVVHSSSAREITVEKGSLKIGRQGSTVSPAFHVDASKRDSIIFKEGTENSVEEWRDVRLENSTDTYYLSCRNKYGYQEWFFETAVNVDPITIKEPVLRESSLNGLPIMDFLDASYYTVYVFNKGVLNNSARLNWCRGEAASTLQNIKEFFMVYRDNDDGYDANICCALLGDNGAGIDFMRKDGSQRCLFDWDYSKAKTANVNKIEVDGQIKSSPIWLSAGKGWHLVHLRLNDNVVAQASAFGRQRQQDLGGIMIAETLIYTNTLTDVEGDAITSYLNNKWKVYEAAVTGPVYDIVNISEGASLEVPVASTVQMVSGAGTLKGLDLTVNAITVKDLGTLVFEGTVKLGMNGTINLAFDNLDTKIIPNEYAIVTWENLVEGSFIGWTLNRSEVPSQYGCKICVQGNSLVARITPPSFIFVVR